MSKGKHRKLKVVGFPDDKGEIEYVALDASTGAHIDGQADVRINVNEDTGERQAQIVIYCYDIVEMESEVEQ